MGILKSLLCTALLFGSTGSFAQTDSAFTFIALNNLDAFADPPKNWTIAGDAVGDFSKPHDLRAVKGTGAVVNDVSKNNRMHLYTKDEMGDVEVELDFMMAKGSNSGVYLQGRYEIQLLDSWTRLNTGWSDEGAIYSRWNPERGSFEGTPPYMNVSRAPGLWQHLQIIFRAPQFNATGQKVRNARFDAVYLNGVLIQEAAFVTGPTASSMFNDEKAVGPLVLQGDHGEVAFKNIRYRKLPPSHDSSDPPPGYRYWETRNPIQIQPGAKAYLLRSFMNFGPKELTHVISAGFPTEVNFSYDLKSGALFQIWRGKYLDVTRMWLGRGEPQLAVPMGSVIPLTDAPVVAVLNDEKEAWPDSVAFDSLQHHGYTLDKKRNPLFTYTINGVDVRDSLAARDDGQGLARTLSVSGALGNVYLRLAAGSAIEAVSPTVFAVGGKTYYIWVSEKVRPVIRPAAGGQELLLKLTNNEPITYSIIW